MECRLPPCPLFRSINQRSGNESEALTGLSQVQRSCRCLPLSGQGWPFYLAALAAHFLHAVDGLSSLKHWEDYLMCWQYGHSRVFPLCSFIISLFVLPHTSHLQHPGKRFSPVSVLCNLFGEERALHSPELCPAIERGACSAYRTFLHAFSRFMCKSTKIYL